MRNDQVRASGLNNKVRSCKPTIEPLEDRLTPAVSVRQVGGVILITGDGAANRVAITQEADNTLLVAVNSSRAYAFVDSVITRITADLKGGNDYLSWSGTKSGGAYGRTASFALGEGDDEAVLDFQDLSAAVSVTAGGGNDKLTCHGFWGADSLQFDAFMERGDDTVTLDRVHGGTSFSIQGGDDNDTLLIDNDYSRVGVTFWGGMGNDRLTGRYVDPQYARLSALMEQGDDTVAVTGQGSIETAVFLMDGGDGNDSLAADFTKDGDSNPLTWNTLHKTLGITMKGGAGNDWLSALYLGKVHGGSLLDLHLHGDADADVVFANVKLTLPVSPSAILYEDYESTYGHGRVLARLEGNDGNDSLGFHYLDDRWSVFDVLMDGGSDIDRFRGGSGSTVKVVSRNIEVDPFAPSLPSQPRGPVVAL